MICKKCSTFKQKILYTLIKETPGMHVLVHDGYCDSGPTSTPPHETVQAHRANKPIFLKSRNDHMTQSLALRCGTNGDLRNFSS